MTEPLLTFDEVSGVTQNCALEEDFPISFELKPGEIGIIRCGILASSVTRLAALRGIVTRGRITILGNSVSAADDPALYLSPDFTKRFIAGIGFCQKSGGLIANLTIIQNVMLPAHYHSNNPAFGPFIELARKRLEEMGVPPKFWYLRSSEVPQEFRKRVLFARSIMNNPPLLILDEPTEEIPWSQTRDVASWILSQKAKGMGILIATGNDPFAALLGDWAVDLCNRIRVSTRSDLETYFGDIIKRSGMLPSRPTTEEKTYA